MQPFLSLETSFKKTESTCTFGLFTISVMPRTISLFPNKRPKDNGPVSTKFLSLYILFVVTPPLASRLKSPHNIYSFRETTYGLEVYNNKSMPAELIPGLPEEIALECLTRLHYSTHRVASQVCRRWRHLIQSKDFYYHRKQAGHTNKAACLVQAIPQESGSHQKKPVGPPKYGVTLFDPVNGTWDRIDPVPQYPDGLPLFCQVTSSEGKLVLIGGWDPVNYEPVSHVFVYEFTTRRWGRGKDMPENRSFFAAGELNGHVIIAGGHDVNKSALNTAWVYNVDEDQWTELPRLSQERDECEGIVIGSAFWVVSGYTTDNQGGFVGSAEFIELGEKKWKRVEDAWKATQCPRSKLGVVGQSGNFFDWADVGTAVKVGACGVQLGAKTTFVSASTYQGGPQGFFLVEGQDGQWEKLKVPIEFSGFLQSGCCVEI